MNYLMRLLFFSFIIYQQATAQKVGIGTTNPLALLHVKDSSVLFSGLSFFSGSPAKPPVSGKGSRTFWYAEKSAFRTGLVYNNTVSGFPDADTSNFHNWDKDSIGFASFAAGYNTKAKGDYSVAIGSRAFSTGNSAAAFGTSTLAKGNYAFAAGSNTVASGESSTAMGNGATASGLFAFASGEFTNSSGIASTALGSNTNAQGKFSTALGSQTNATGDYATSIGDNTTAGGDYSTAMGEYTTASGDYSTAVGKNTTASGYSSTAMGINASTNSHSNSFSIGGTGAAVTNTSDNQMMMRFDNYTFWVSASNYAYLIPAGNGWAYTSDKNKKERLLETDGEIVLKKLAAIQLSSWNFKAADTRKYRHYGIMAQDFYSAFGKDKYGIIGNDTTVSPLDMLGIAYSGIKALEKRSQLSNAKMTGQQKQLEVVLLQNKELQEANNHLEKINTGILKQNNLLAADIAQLKKQYSDMAQLITKMKLESAAAGGNTK